MTRLRDAKQWIPAPSILDRIGLQSIKRRALYEKIGIYTAVLIACIFAVFPIYWMFLTSIQLGKGGAFLFPPVFYPTSPSVEAYRTIIHSDRYPILLWIRNSLIVSIATAVLCVLVAAFGGYAFSRYNFRGRGILQQSFLLIRMIPTALIVIPLYILIIRLRLNDTFFALILANTSFALPLSLFMLKGYFDTVPYEIEEAALMDGCNRLQILFRIVLPICAPGIAATFLYGFIMGWSEFLFARTFISSGDLFTGAVGMSTFIGEHVAQWSEMMAAAFLYSIPVSILFLFLQKYLVTGLAAGAVKQ